MIYNSRGPRGWGGRNLCETPNELVWRSRVESKCRIVALENAVSSIPKYHSLELTHIAEGSSVSSCLIAHSLDQLNVIPILISSSANRIFWGPSARFDI
jgi:hypothetical protein